MPVRILLLEDSPLDAELIGEHMAKAPFACEIDRVVTRDEFARALGRQVHDLILSDYALPAFDGLSALDMARAQVPETPFIFISGMFGEETATETLKRGATDYVLKQRMNRLPAAVGRALKEAEALRERRRAEARTRLLVAELSHRVKNTLATVVAIAQQTFQKSATLEEFRPAFMGRLETLAEAHALLFRADWSELDIKAVLSAALSPFSDTQDAIELDGGPVRIPPSHALTLNLVVHELATNACKYGALSVPGGRVRIAWEMEESGERTCVRFSWEESGGPSVEPPLERGFGASLIERAIAYEFDGESSLEFPRSGVICRLCMPVEREADGALAGRYLAS
ncbi:HWE histidine kinase domain-containing protein [Chthonobacter albigriseus]|uniref:HWE histidine kinase domain-containing protein n=1 Tax=Chthonobacter albigriseus TaxID=1683161 RepID=UPI0015EEB99C|nr:HWE histidine kinase domain-containing protein [Chthonobacter albigriseus]